MFMVQLRLSLKIYRCACSIFHLPTDVLNVRKFVLQAEKLIYAVNGGLRITLKKHF